MRILGGVVIVGSILTSILLFGSAGRDKQLLQDVDRVGEVLAPHTKAGIPSEMWNDWSLQTYLMRYHFISLEADQSEAHWYMTEKGGMPIDTSAYSKQDIGLIKLDLWRRTR
jgi:hypothetical protein